MLTTQSASLPYPEDEDLPETATHIQNIATALDTLTIPRYSGSATRDAAITVPTNGQAAYLQDTEQLNFYKSDYAAWMPANYPSINRIQASDQGFTTNVMADSLDITGMETKTNTMYLIRGYFQFSSPSAADAAFRMFWTGSIDVNLSFWCIRASKNGSAIEQSSALASSLIGRNTDDSYIHHSVVDGVVYVTGGGTMKLQCSKVNATGANMVLYAGSYLELVEAF